VDLAMDRVKAYQPIDGHPKEARHEQGKANSTEEAQIRQHEAGPVTPGHLGDSA
jgi:hypothetical protein